MQSDLQEAMFQWENAIVQSYKVCQPLSKAVFNTLIVPILICT